MMPSPEQSAVEIMIGKCISVVSSLLIRRSPAYSSISGQTGGSSSATWPPLDLFQNGPSLYYTSKDLIPSEGLSFALSVQELSGLSRDVGFPSCPKEMQRVDI